MSAEQKEKLWTLWNDHLLPWLRRRECHVLVVLLLLLYFAGSLVTFLLVAGVGVYAHKQEIDILKLIRDPSVVDSSPSPISRIRNRLAPIVPERASQFLSSPAPSFSRPQSSRPVTVYDQLSPILSLRPLGLERTVITTHRGESCHQLNDSDRQKRTAIAHELLDTERNYVKNVELMIQHYVKPLREVVGKSNEIIPKADIDSIFSSIDVIYAYNCKLRDDLQSRLSSWDPNTTLLGDIMLTMSDFLKTYTFFVGNYPIALQTLNRLESSSKFVKFIKGVRVSSHTLESLLIQPIQRLPRYILLLQELCKHTWKQHPDWETLFQALDKMKDVTQHLNTGQEKIEHLHAIMELSKKVIGPNKQPLTGFIEPSRTFVKSGPLYEHPGNGSPLKKGRKMWYFLFNDSFLRTVKKDENRFKATTTSVIPFTSISDIRTDRQVGRKRPSHVLTAAKFIVSRRSGSGSGSGSGSCLLSSLGLAQI